MKRLLLLICFLLPVLTAAAQEGLSEPPRPPVYTAADLAVTPLEEGVWVIETDDRTTMYLVEGTERALLIDTGTHPAELDRVVRRFTRKPLFVVLTHAHYDHAGGIGFFGLPGFVIGPILVSLFLALWEIYAIEFKSQLERFNG